MKKFDTHFSESYLSEASITKMDFFKRQNKQTFLDKVAKGVLVSVSGEKLPIKDNSIWMTVKSDIEKANDHNDLPADFNDRFKKAIAPFKQVEKGGNGLSPQSGNDPTGEDWEAGITVALDKLAGRNFMDSPEWERFGKYWGDWEEQAMRTGQAFKKELGISKLEQTGSKRASLSSTWKGTNATPKTDLLGGSHRISLKKAGGSQLMSAGKDESISTLEAAMATYGVNGQSKKEFNILLKSFEENLIKMSEKGQMSQLRRILNSQKKLRSPTQRLLRSTKILRSTLTIVQDSSLTSVGKQQQGTVSLGRTHGQLPR